MAQYRFTDLFLFAVILVAAELIIHYVGVAWGSVGMFTYSPLVPVVLLVMMRWGWPSVFYAVADGILYCALKGGAWQTYLIYGIGNAFIMLLLLAVKFAGRQRIAGKWYFSALFVVIGWLLVALGRSIVSACCGLGFAGAFLSNVGIGGSGLFSLAIGLLIILILRRLDGMFEGQKHYLKRLDNERKERMRRDTFGDEPVEIDEESLSILKKRDDELQ